MNHSPLAIMPPESPSEAEIAARIRAGNSEALGRAYCMYAAPLLVLAMRILGNAADAEDVVQDLFVGLPEALAHYEERGQLAAWLRRIVVRLVLMKLRAARRRQETDLGGALGSPVSSADELVDASGVARALEQLPDEQRAVVVLRVVEGYSHHEIAELLGIRRNTAEVRFHRALHRLRKLLEAS